MKVKKDNVNIISLLKELFGTVTTYNKRCFLLPDGTFVPCPDNFGGLQKSHSFVTAYLLNKLQEMGEEVSSKTPLEDMGCIHLNGERENYIFLSELPLTKDQRTSLVWWIDEFFTNKNYKEYLKVMTPDHKQLVEYSPMEYDGNTIVQKINRYYNTGTLYEEKKKK